MVALTWLRGLLAHRRGRLLATAAGVAVAVALLASIGSFLSATTVEDDHSARSRGYRSTGRSRPRAGANPPTSSRRSRRQPGVARALPVRLRRPPAGSRPPPAARRRAPARARCSASRRLRAGVPRRDPRALGQRHGRAARPADRRQPARPAGRHRQDRARPAAPGHASRSTASSTCRPPTRCSSRSARPSARSRRRRRTTSSCCPRRVFARARARRAGHDAGPRASRPPPARQPAARPSPRSPGTRATSRRSSPAAGLVGDNLGTALDQARQDALYAELLFLFLGVPGAVLAGLVTAVDRFRGRRAATARRRAAAHPRRLDAPARADRAGRDRAGRRPRHRRRARRRAARSARGQFGTASFGAGTLAAALWAGGAALAGVAIAAASIALPA